MSLFQPRTQDEEIARRRRITFKVYGNPISKGSARPFMVKGKGGAPDRAIIVQAKDRNLRDWEGLIRTAAQQHAGSNFFAAGSPVAVKFWFYFTRPKSKKAQAPMVSRPDWDKVSRAVCDALQDVLFKDDCQITTAQVGKRYTNGASHVLVSLEQDWAACDDSIDVTSAGVCWCRKAQCECQP